MDSELVSDSVSTLEGCGHESSHPIFTYTKTFYEHFPYYLSIGMTAEQYWDGDPDLVKYYRKAEEIRTERRNQEFWLQGMYIYEALADVSPILHAFAKKGTRPHPYTDKPYPLSEKQRKVNKVNKDKAVCDKGKKIMEAFMKVNNAKFKEKADV